MLRSLLLLVFIVLASLAPAWAWAAPGEVTVSFELDGEPELPAWVCVVSRAKGRTQLDTAALLARVDARGEVPASTHDAPPRPSRSSSGTLEDALAAMQPQPAEPHCGALADGGEACAPRIELEPSEHRFVACTANERHAGRRPRVLWLELAARDSQGAPAAVERLSLNGSVLTLSTNLRGSEAVTVVQTIGGHYRAEGDVRVRGARVATLSLEPICRWIPVRVPPIQLPSGDEADPRPTFVLEDDGHSAQVPSACVRGSLADGTLEVRVPYNEAATTIQERRGMNLRATIDQEVPREVLWRPVVDDEEGEGDGLTRREVVVIQQAQAQAAPELDEQVAPEVPAALPEPFAITLSARWSGPWPSEALSLRPEVVTFFWPRDACFYPEGCPEARLASSAKTCDRYSRTDGCYYRCDVGHMQVGVVGEDFKVPITLIDLDHGAPRPEWGATLQYLNQRFLRSVPLEQRRVRVDLGAWSRSFTPPADASAAPRGPGPSYGEVLLAGDGSRARRRARHRGPESYASPAPVIAARGDEIEAISLRGAYGNVHRIELGAGEHREYYFNLPQARCGETVQVELRGARQYRSTDVALRRGTLALEHPLRLARVLYFGTGLSLGFTRVLSPGDVRGVAPWSPAASVDFSLRFRFRRLWRAWRFELPRVSTMVTTQPYAPLSPDPGQTARKPRRALYNRFLLAAMARTPDFPGLDLVKMSVAFGLGLDVGAPLRSSDVDAVGEVNLGLVPLAELLVRVGPRVELRLFEPRLVCLESFHRHTTDLRGVVSEDVARGQMCTLFLGAGVAGTW